MSTVSGPARRCLVCDAMEPVSADQLVWPLGWRCPACSAAVDQRDGIAMFAPALADTISGMDPDNFEALSKVEAEHFWFVARNKLIVGLANNYFPHARSFLEIGCGNGAVLSAVSQSRSWDRLVGSELHPSGLAFARKRLPSGVEFVQMDARKIPAKEVFDLTGAFDVVEHIADDEAVLRGMREATRAGGGIIVAVPQHPWLWSFADEIALHERRYRRGELETKMRRNGFEILFSTSYTAVLLPLMAISRFANRNRQSKENVELEFAVNRRVNSLLKVILLGEVSLTLKGVRWPAGGSRIVVGRAV